LEEARQKQLANFAKLFNFNFFMEKSKKEGRYARIFEQLKDLLNATQNVDARMATLVAVLHHKMDYFFWTGFYCLDNGILTVKTYQGPVACQVLKKDTGVCWAGINQNKTIVVPDVHAFPGHIACDSRSNSEIVVPIRTKSGEVFGVLDVDSKELASFDETDAHWLEKIVNLI
jgi:GAF domain-containing protein